MSATQRGCRASPARVRADSCGGIAKPLWTSLRLSPGDRGVDGEYHCLVSVLARLGQVRQAHCPVLHQVELEPDAPAGGDQGDVADRGRDVRRERVGKRRRLPPLRRRRAPRWCGSAACTRSAQHDHGGRCGPAEDRGCEVRRGDLPEGGGPQLDPVEGLAVAGASRPRRRNRPPRSPTPPAAPGVGRRVPGRRRTGSARAGVARRRGGTDGSGGRASGRASAAPGGPGGVIGCDTGLDSFTRYTISCNSSYKLRLPLRETDHVRHASATCKLSHVVLPLDNPVSDAKVLTGRQKPLTETVLLFVEVTTEQGHRGMGFSYSKRAGGPAQYAHLKEVAEVAIGQDPSDIDRIYQSLLWAGASVGRSGVATQAIAALDVALWDLKARRAGLPLAKLIGAHRDSCRGLQHLRRLPAGLGRGDQGEGDRLAGGGHRRHQDQGRPARLARPTSSGWPRCASTSATARSWSTPTSSGTAPAPAGCAASSKRST